MELGAPGKLGLPFPQSELTGESLRLRHVVVFIPVFIARDVPQFARLFTIIGPRLTFPTKASLNVRVQGVFVWLVSVSIHLHFCGVDV